MDDIIKLTIDGEEVETTRGMTVLQAAEAAGMYIPTLCADHDLSPWGACRVCVVEIEGMRGLPTACTTPVASGMVVRTESPLLERARQLAIELIRSDHPIDCNACPKNNQCDLQMSEAVLGITGIRFRSLPKDLPVDTSNPFFKLDRNYCILCAKCVRSCEEIAGVENYTLAERGYKRHVATFGDGLLINSNCVSCGECVDHCPVYALTPQDTKKAEQQTASICPYCGVGCAISIGTRHEQVVNTTGRREGTVNEGRLCVRGRFSIAEFVHHPQRLTNPMVRRDGKLVEATWDEALDLVAKKLGGYRGAEVAVIPSDKCTNEDTYIVQKFARAVLGTNNVNHMGRLIQAPDKDGLAQCFGRGAMTNSINEITDTACILAFGTNTTVDHPVIGENIKKAVRKGARLIVANPREIDLVHFAGSWLRYKPGTEVALLMGVMRVIIDESLLDKAFVQERCENFDAFASSLKDFDLKSAESITGVPAADIAAAARMFASVRPATIIYDADRASGTLGTAMGNLAMLTGNIGKPSAGVAPLLGENNEQGACDMGALPDFYPGYQPVKDPAVKQKFETAWGCTLDSFPGLTVPEILQSAVQGQIKAMYLIGENPVLSEPDVKHTREALAKLEFLVVQDIFLSETAQMAHVVFPASSYAEKDGSFTNTERRVQLIKKAVDTVGRSRPDWLITCQLAQKMGKKGFDFSDPARIMDEIASLTPDYAGISYERLESGGLQWPCPTKELPGTPILYTEAFIRGKGQFQPLVYEPSAEPTSKDYPLTLIMGQSLYHFNTGTRTRKVKGLNVLKGEDLVEINPDDARALGITDGDSVKVISRHGEVAIKARVTDVSPAGTVFMTTHFAANPANLVTGAAFDPATRAAEPGSWAVRIEKS